MTLKLGVATYNYLWRYSIEQTIEHISKLGFQIIEIMTTFPHAWPNALDKKSRLKLHDLLASYNLKVKAINPTFGDLNLASPRPTVRKLTVEEIKEQIRFAHDIEAEIVVVVPGTRHLLGPPPLEIAWKYAIEGIIECAKVAEDYGVTIGLEHTPYRFIEKTEQLKRMIEEIGLDSVKAVFDVSNTSVIEPLVPAIETLGKLIEHVHLADNDCKTWGKLPIGTGAIDFTAVARALNKIKFHGVSIIELWYLDADPDEPIIASKKRLEALGWVA